VNGRLVACTEPDPDTTSRSAGVAMIRGVLDFLTYQPCQGGTSRSKMVPGTTPNLVVLGTSPIGPTSNEQPDAEDLEAGSMREELPLRTGVNSGLSLLHW
jgi:hypothetical protein